MYKLCEGKVDNLVSRKYFTQKDPSECVIVALQQVECVELQPLEKSARVSRGSDRPSQLTKRPWEINFFMSDCKRRYMRKGRSETPCQTQGKVD